MLLGLALCHVGCVLAMAADEEHGGFPDLPFAGHHSREMKAGAGSGVPGAAAPIILYSIAELAVCSGSAVISTRAKPCSVMPSASAARVERSMTRPSIEGPRSLTLTSTERPFSRLVTRAQVMSGRVRCAAVSLFSSKTSPLAVSGP